MSTVAAPETRRRPEPQAALAEMPPWAEKAFIPVFFVVAIAAAVRAATGRHARSTTPRSRSPTS